MGLFDPFVGLAWADKGRGEAVDCWGLVHKVFADLRGIDLPSYGERYATAADRRALAGLIDGELDAWREIQPGSELRFDAVLMRKGAFASHVGIVTDPGLVLHVSAGETSVIERYRSGVLARRVVGFFRFKGGE